MSPVLSVPNKIFHRQVTVFGDPIIWTSIVGTIIILTAVLAMMLEDEVQKILNSVKKPPPKALKGSLCHQM